MSYEFTQDSKYPTHLTIIEPKRQVGLTFNSYTQACEARARWSNGNYSLDDMLSEFDSTPEYHHPETYPWGLKITPKPEDTNFLLLAFKSFEVREKVKELCSQELNGGRKLRDRLENEPGYSDTFACEFGAFRCIYYQNTKEV